MIESKLQIDCIGFEPSNEAQNPEKPIPNRMIANKLTVLINDIGIAMKALNYGMFQGKIYKKVEGAQYTYAVKCEAREFLNSLAANEHFKGRLISEITKLNEILSDTYCEVVRPIKINYNLIEVLNGQCWSIKEKKLMFNAISENDKGKVSPRAFCRYDSTKPPEPKYFKEILENSLCEEDVSNFCTDFLKLLEHKKKKHKDKVPCLVGEPNSGKTSLFYPLLGIIHHANVATITKQRAFNKSMITRFTEIVL